MPSTPYSSPCSESAPGNLQQHSAIFFTGSKGVGTHGGLKFSFNARAYVDSSRHGNLSIQLIRMHYPVRRPGGN